MTVNALRMAFIWHILQTLLAIVSMLVIEVLIQTVVTVAWGESTTSCQEEKGDKIDHVNMYSMFTP
jgi:hypothetical protein